MLPDIISKKILFTDGCWFWEAALDRYGYGVIRWNNKTCRAHRVVYFELVGKTELELDHLCRNHRCVNPNHLEAVTHSENVSRGNAPKISSNRWAKPRKCPSGHPLSGDNLYTHYNEKLKRLNRQCRICKRENKKKYRAAKTIY